MYDEKTAHDEQEFQKRQNALEQHDQGYEKYISQARDGVLFKLGSY